MMTKTQGISDKDPVAPSDAKIAELASELNAAIRLECRDIVDHALGLPEHGTDAWARQVVDRNSLVGRLRIREVHVTRLRVRRAAKVDLEPAVAEARAAGLTWDQIGKACGITRQAAYDRWGGSSKVPIEDDQDPLDKYDPERKGIADRARRRAKARRRPPPPKQQAEDVLDKYDPERKGFADRVHRQTARHRVSPDDAEDQ